MRYDEHDPAQAMMAVLHETGHALYERGLPEPGHASRSAPPPAWRRTKASRLILEMQACRSDPFLGWLARELVPSFGGEPAPCGADNLARLWRRVERGFIRVDADEMTYPAHVILRFRLEQALFAGDLRGGRPARRLERRHARRCSASCRPTTRAAACRTSTGTTGAFGYFPSYTLGAMAAAQLMAAARRAVPGLDAALARGDLRRWSAGCAGACTASAAGSASTTCCATPPAGRSAGGFRGTSDGALPELRAPPG